MAEELDYVSMPQKVVGQIQTMWSKEIKDSSGKPLHVTSN
jgi:phosphate transport system substrate-binding protein